MSGETRKSLTADEYDKVGDMLLELLEKCPYVPRGVKIRYNSEDVGECICIFTTGGNYTKKYISGSFEAELWLEIGYQSFPQGNGQPIDAQAVVDNIAGWLEDIGDLPRLSGGRTVTKFTANNSFPAVKDVEGDRSTTFAVKAAMGYFKKGA